MQETITGRQPGGRVALRLFLLDEKTGEPVAGVVVSVFADSPRVTDSRREKETHEGRGRRLATLQTDQAGYVSFKLDASAVAAASRLTVSYGASRAEALVLNPRDVLEGGGAYTVRVDISDAAISEQITPLPSVMQPDAQDLVVSPNSIGLIPRMAQRPTLCRQLQPTTMVVRRFGAFQIQADICNPEFVTCPERIEIVRGKMLEYEITWNPAGTSLGELLNTLALAPCEQINVAIVDWMHRETATQTETSDLTQQAVQTLDHDRMITETMSGSVRNQSKAWGVGGTVTAKFPIKKIDVTASFGGGVSSSSTIQNLSATTTNQLSESIVQESSFVASRRSTMVFQTTASEQRTFQTRTVRNNNHCHMLNLMYYQVNRNYEVVTEYKGSRDVILIKYNFKEFDAKIAFCYAHLLKEALLDQSLVGCFDELADALFCCDIKPPAPPPPANKLLMDSLTITVKPKEVIFGFIWLRIDLYSATGQFPISQINTLVNPQWQSGGVHTQTLPLSTPIDPAQVAWMEINLHKGSLPVAHVIFNEIELTYHVMNDGDFPFYSTQTQTVINPTLRTPVQPQLPGQQTPPTVPVVNECVENSCCIQKLLAHLNCHKRYYSSILFLNTNPDDRVPWLACCRKADGTQFSLIAEIENAPVTTYGDYVVFPVAGSQLVPGDVLPVSRLVTFPTPGVFAEGILGECNTCEKIDQETFWDWKDSPCPDNAPAVADLPDAQTGGVKPGDLKPEAISNTISFASPSSGPESFLKDLISTLIEKADAGSSEAKALLEKLLESIKQSA